MKSCKLHAEWIEELDSTLFFPIVGSEALLFHKSNVYSLFKSFPYFYPLGHKFAHVTFPEKFEQLHEIILKRPKFVCIHHKRLFLPLEFDIEGEEAEDTPPFVRDYLDYEGNINPMLMLIKHVDNPQTLGTLYKISKIGWPYKEIFDPDNKILNNKVYELFPNTLSGIIYSRFKKELSGLLEKYPNLFKILIGTDYFRKNIPAFYVEKIESKPEKIIKYNKHEKSKIGALFFTISSHEVSALRKLNEELQKENRIFLVDNREAKIKSKLVEGLKLPRSKIFDELFGRYEVIPERKISYIKLRMDTYFEIDKFKEFISLLRLWFDRIIRRAEKDGNELGDKKVSLKGLRVLIHDDIWKEERSKIELLIDKYYIFNTLSTVESEIFPTYPGYKPIDLRLPVGLNIFAGGGSSKSSSKLLSLKDADLLTNLAVRYILDGKINRGLILLKATNEAIKEEIQFLRTGKKPRFQELQIYLQRYEDKLVGRRLEHLPLFSYDEQKLEKYRKANEKYLKLASEKGDKSPFVYFINTVRLIRKTTNPRIIQDSEYKLGGYIISLGIEEIFNIDNILAYINLNF